MTNLHLIVLQASGFFMLLAILVFLILVIGVAVLMGSIFAVMDSRKQSYKPFSRALTIAGAETVLAIGLFLMIVLLAWRQGIGITVVALIIAVVVIFGGAFFAGLVGYLIGYRGDKTFAAEGSYGEGEVTTRVEESGNPYQPPST